MRSVHERELPVAATVGRLLDRLGGPDDPLWPAPAWPPMRVDQPLAVGGEGAHGPIRYVVSAYDPGRRVEFRTRPQIGLDGRHAFEIEALDGQRCVLRHVLDARPTGWMRLGWPLVMRWLHDAIVEDLLDNAELRLTGSVRAPSRWSPWVRLLRCCPARVRATSIPAGAVLVRAALPRVDYADAYSVVVPADVNSDPQAWTDALLHGLPAAVGPGPRRAESTKEVVLGADERHLSYRASVLVEPAAERTTVTLSTVVGLHSPLGRAYFGVVRRIHPFLMRALLRRAASRMATGPGVPVSVVE